MEKKYLHITILFFIFFGNWCFGQTDCSNATSITINGSCLSASIADTSENAPNVTTAPNCSPGVFKKERWFTFTVTSGPQDIIITASASSRNLYLQLISGTCGGTLTQIACANAFTANNSAQTETINYTGLANGTYYIKVSNVGNNSSNMNLTSLCVTSPPINNNCSGATGLTVNPTSACSTSTSGTTIGANQSQSECTGTADDDVWYSFVATSTAHTITVTPGTLSDAVLEVFSGSCGSLVSQSCIDATAGSSSETVTLTGLTATNTYFVRVYSYGSSGRGTFSVCITTPTDPCSSISTIATCGTTINANLVSGAGLYANGCGNSTPGSELIYSFTPASTGAYSINQTSSYATINYQIKLASSGCSGTGWTCIDDINGSGISPTFTLTAGTAYYILLDPSNTTGGNVDFSIVCAPPIPTNDQCSGAISLTVNATNNCVSSTNGTTIGAIQSQAGCSGTADDDVWYSFIATNTTHTVTVTAISLNNIVFEVFRNSCGSLVSLGCVNSTTGFSPETTTLTGLTIGNTYSVRVYSNGNGNGQGTFNICVTTPVDPCTVITTISSCNSVINLNVPSGNGFYGTSACGYTTSGNETIYSYTPSVTGLYTISQTNSFAFIDYQFKLASSGCSGTGWTCIDDMFGAMTSPSFTLTAGQTYYFLLDPESSIGGAVSFTINCPAPTPTNDDCATAFPLAVSTNCNYETYTNAGTTNSVGVPAPGCANYAGRDVWFSVVVPANGSVRIDTRQGVITDSGMAVYSGTCGSLTLIECDDDDSSNGLMSMINLTGLTPGSTIFIRFWEYGNDNNGTFGICVTSPEPCTSGNGIGNTADGCPAIFSGGLGLFGSDPDPIDPCNSTSCVDLEATYLTIGSPTTYSVEQIAYNPPPYQFNCLANPISVNIDDVWSPVINLPFDFCFYGGTYNSCIVGSNGMISFDTANAGGSTGWRFDENLPSLDEALFPNTIFGVYHDIDPSKGGEVGWELITLDTGCRALVAAWNDVPMFSNNTILYTGMIVLYENTNIIEVYVKEKNIDNFNVSPWNGGNAIIGLQNGDASQAVVAPNRNSLDTNWTATSEAWRFTPSGTTLTSIQWFEGSGTSGTPLDTTDVISVCPTTTTTYTARVTYNLCTGGTIVITDETTVTVIENKTWDGSESEDWHNDDNWTPFGIPNGSDCVTIPNTGNDPIISGTNYNGLAGTLTIHNNASLTINSNNSITVTDFVDVNTGGTFLINNDASLIQINNATNFGDIIYKREASIRTLDYVYWSSPVFNQSFSGLTAPIVSGPIYEWNTTFPNPNGGQGNWRVPSTSTMTRGKGYIIRGPSTAPFNNTTHNILVGTFTGVPNNGDIFMPISRGSDENTLPHYGTNGSEISNYSDNWNLIGNPYPSSIRASQFLFNNRTKIMGNVRLWTHGTIPNSSINNPFYGSFGYNYTPGDYLTFNFTGTSCCPAINDDLFIGSGQGFMVQMIDGPETTDIVSFNNGLRNAAYPNDFFFRNANSTQNSNAFNFGQLERNRIWLDIINSNNKTDRTLFGYIEGATIDVDNSFDCLTQNIGIMSIYSLSNNKKFLIQGRGLPFDDNDVVPIGIVIQNEGNHTLAIAGVDGLFSSQEIYLRDNLLNSIHDIKASPYQFYSTNGMFNNRFEIVYKNSTLSIDEILNKNEVIVFTKNEINVVANETIEKIEVFNILGQKIESINNIDREEVAINSITKSNASLLLKIKLKNGIIVDKKIIY